ncbi:MAG: hypothetical protein MN733_30185, partial [Nitrososphaera sp.]|nr:hypothetical protein [Nitrososphaera sp.]
PGRAGGGCGMSLIRINRTGQPQVTPASDGRLTISVPIQIKRRSGRKVVVIPSGAERPRDGDPTPLQLALARGHRGLTMLESGEVKSLREIASKEGVDSSYVSRMVNLTTLAPDIVAAIFDETFPPDMTLFELAVDPPDLWKEQRRRIDWTSDYRSHILPQVSRPNENNRGLSPKHTKTHVPKTHTWNPPADGKGSFRPI